MSDAELASSHSRLHRYAGIRRMSPALYQGQEDAEVFEGLPEGFTHWDVFWRLDRAATPMGFSRVEIDTLRVLWKFSQAQDWRTGSRPIVWPSNETLMLELGLSRSALKYRLRSLATKRLITFKDSPTGKRYGHRDHAGELILEVTFGIDLSAAVQQLDACERAAERYDVERGLRRDLRRRRTIAVKATRQAIETVIEYELAVDVEALQAELVALPDVTDPWVPFAVLRDCTDRAERLRAAAEDQVQAALGRGQGQGHHDDDHENFDPAGPAVGPHIQITTNPKIDLSNYRNAASRNESRRARPQADPGRAKEAVTDAMGGGNAGANSESHGHGSNYISRSMALKLMPRAMREFMAEAFPDRRAATWANLVDIAHWHLASLGISEKAWSQACEAIGRNGAAIAVFIIAAKAHEIRKPDRYLRSMAYRADAGELQLHRSAWGILRGGTAEPGHA